MNNRKGEGKQKKSPQSVGKPRESLHPLKSLDSFQSSAKPDSGDSRGTFS